MGIVADKTAIQFRMLNRSKGPAVWSPRVQSDRTKYIEEWREILDSIDNLDIFQDNVVELILASGNGGPCHVRGVKTALGIEFSAAKVILTTGTFLNGLMHFGATKIAGGRISEGASTGVTEQLRALGMVTGRMKTGTPARIDGRSIDYSKAEKQEGDKNEWEKFSFLPEIKRTLKTRPCWIVRTNPECHGEIMSRISESPLYNGDINSIGPRYCPSIETKLVTFPDRDSHQLFLEPEGETTQEYYVNGFSSSMPWEVQIKALERIPALNNVHIYRPGYAIEYDFFDPTQLRHSLETKLINGLYMAGQINGTTGYEEAAAQGLMAGINAALSVRGENPLILGRDEAYIGVLIDDLVTKGVDEPYRMFTSRAEYRILLRQDNADERLTPIGYQIGLADKRRKELLDEKLKYREELLRWAETRSVRPTQEINSWLESLGSAKISGSVKVADLIRRPHIGFRNLMQLPIGDEILTILNNKGEKNPRFEEIIDSAEIILKYSGYINRERDLAEKQSRLEGLKIPANYDFDNQKALSTEARQKLSTIRPATIGQASRIPGVSPADINILLVLLGR